MNEDDPRHGTTAGYNQGCRETCCQTAIADWTRNYRTRQYLHGPLTVDPIGVKRRIRALMALGWSTTQMDERLGRKRTYTAAVLLGGPVFRSTADQYAALYEEMAMTLPPTGTRYEKQRATRLRNYAQKQGWPPPLAWVDIDDPDETPGDWSYVPSDRETAVRELAAQGENPTQIARRLGLNHRALERWCLRHTPDIWRQLVAREGDWNSTGNLSHQTMRGGAA